MSETAVTPRSARDRTSARIRERRQRCRELLHRHYRDVPTREEVFDDALGSLLQTSHTLLDAGCGADFPFLTQYAPRVAFAVGVDLCPPTAAVAKPVHVVVGNLEQLPLDSGRFDVIMSRSVVEHLDHPRPVFRELARVLRPGGKLIFTTPNRYYYSCLIALLTPERLKARYFQTVFGPDAYDHFPVRYRANTRRALAQVAAAAGLRIVRLEGLRHYPYYLMFSPVLFRAGILYDRAVTALGLDWLQSTWLVVMEKV
jgi:SAM-dependent methyltransferase